MLAALENSDISADSQDFRGGNVRISTSGIFGTQFREQLTLESDITATGASSELSGTVDIITPDVDPTSGLAQLPATFIDATGLVDRSCPRAGGNVTDRRFIVTGRGGLPPSPNEPLNEEGLLEDLGTPIAASNQEQVGREAVPVASGGSSGIEEASGWMVNEKDQVVLIAQSSAVNYRGNLFNSAECNLSQTDI